MGAIWRVGRATSILVVFFAVSNFATAANPFEGTWAFSLPDGYPAWLRISQLPGSGAAGIEVGVLWSIGSEEPARVTAASAELIEFVRDLTWQPSGDPAQTRKVAGPMIATLDGDRLKLVVKHTAADGSAGETLELVGKHMPPMPPTPELTKVKFGEAIELFNGRDLAGWRLSDPKKKNGWRVADGVLVNDSPKTDFGAYGEQGNLRTDRKFGDFRLSLEYRVPAGGNSGVYLRGMYEAQVVDGDSRMQGIQGPGALYGRIAPSQNAGKPGGEWNQYVLTLVDRHVTVELNGQTVIDNQPVIGCTGGGIAADDTAPGPILLQGDHTAVEYRKLVLEPVVESP